MATERGGAEVAGVLASRCVWVGRDAAARPAVPMPPAAEPPGSRPRLANGTWGEARNGANQDLLH